MWSPRADQRTASTGGTVPVLIGFGALAQVLLVGGSFLTAWFRVYR